MKWAFFVAAVGLLGCTSGDSTQGGTGGTTPTAEGGNGGASSGGSGGESTLAATGGGSAGGFAGGGGFGLGGSVGSGGAVGVGGSAAQGGSLAADGGVGGTQGTGGLSGSDGPTATGGAATGGSSGTGGSSTNCPPPPSGGPAVSLTGMGKDCLQCHSSSGGQNPKMISGGVIYKDPGAKTPAVGATVTISDGVHTSTAVTGTNGLFYFPATDPITFPANTKVSLCPDTQTMVTNATSGSCGIASCHGNLPITVP